MKKENNIEEGFVCFKDYVSPSYVNTKSPKYIEIDGVYYSGIMLVDYNREYKNLILKNIIEKNLNMNISIFYEKQDSYKVIRELTYNIGNVGADIKEKNFNSEDIDIAAFTYNDAKYIRKEIQINNEDLYFLYIYIIVYDENIKELEKNINIVEGILQSSGIQTKKSFFRQEQLFKSTLPFAENNKDIKSVTKRNILTSGIVSTYPFISSNIFDEKGIFLGINIKNNSLVFVDKYEKEKYKNSNMCIFGTSGAGKSFFSKTMILRNRMMGIEQYVIDPEREYNNLCENLDGILLKIGPTSNTFINVFDIREDSIEDNNDGYLLNKLNKILGFFYLIFGEINEEEKAIIEEAIIKCYEKKGINFDDKSLYNKNNKFKSSEEMPKIEDLYNILGEKKKTEKYQKKLIPFVKGSLKFFNNYTNINLENKLIVADIYDLGEENLKYGMYIFTDLFWDKIKKDRKIKKSIYLDEIWRLIGITSNKEVASFIYKIFKTIRKYGGSAIAITQDISDLFSLENGVYGKSILNNSSIKAFFSLEEENIKILSEYTNLSTNEKIEIKNLKKGECLMFIENSHITLKNEVSEFEKNIIE